VDTIAAVIVKAMDAICAPLAARVRTLEKTADELGAIRERIAALTDRVVELEATAAARNPDHVSR
jgi:hypothetical protein